MLLLTPDFKGGYYTKVWPHENWHNYQTVELESVEGKRKFPWICKECEITEIYRNPDWFGFYPIRCKKCNTFKTRHEINKRWKEVIWKTLKKRCPRNKTIGQLKLVTFTTRSPTHAFYGTTHENIGDIVRSDLFNLKNKFMKLKRTSAFKKFYNGGFYCLEATAKIKFTPGNEEGLLHTHPHVHMIAKCNRIDFGKTNKWETQYGIRTNHKMITDIKGAVGYITSYISKDRLISHRLRDSFGTFRGVKIK